jgi:hypothetical protein
MDNAQQAQGPQEQATPPPSSDVVERSLAGYLLNDLNNVITSGAAGALAGAVTAHFGKGSGGGSETPPPSPGPDAGPPPASGQLKLSRPGQQRDG